MPKAAQPLFVVGMSGSGPPPPGRRFGDLKGPVLVSSVVTLYFTIVTVLRPGAPASLPQTMATGLALQLLAGLALSHGVILLVLVSSIVVSERRRSLTEIFASLGLRRLGLARSLMWGLACFPLYVLIGLVFLLVAPSATPTAPAGPTPPWYPYYAVLTAFFPVAVVEEALGRGYLLDRMLPEQPCGLVRAAPAILLSSLLFTLYHAPSYIAVYAFSPGRTALLLGLNVFPLSAALGVAFVRSRTRNVAGPVLMHFLFDSLPYLVFVIL